jgi:hypothetical protein
VRGREASKRPRKATGRTSSVGVGESYSEMAAAGRTGLFRGLPGERGQKNNEGVVIRTQTALRPGDQRHPHAGISFRLSTMARAHHNGASLRWPFGCDQILTIRKIASNLIRSWTAHPILLPARSPWLCAVRPAGKPSTSGMCSSFRAQSAAHKRNARSPWSVKLETGTRGCQGIPRERRKVEATTASPAV